MLHPPGKFWGWDAVWIYNMADRLNRIWGVWECNPQMLWGFYFALFKGFKIDEVVQHDWYKFSRFSKTQGTMAPIRITYAYKYSV